MKKTYIQPDMEIMKIETQQMLATSIPLDGGTPVDNGNALAPEFPEILTSEDLFGIPEP